MNTRTLTTLATLGLIAMTAVWGSTFVGQWWRRARSE